MQLIVEEKNNLPFFIRKTHISIFEKLIYKTVSMLKIRSVKIFWC